MGLFDLIRRGRYVADSDSVLVPRAGRSPSLAQVACDIRAGGDALSLTRDFLDHVRRRTDEELGALIWEHPVLTGDERADALLAGVAEHFAAVRKLPCPAWVHEQGRFLDRFWFVSSVPGFRAIALAQTPMALKRRGVLWPARSMERV